MCLSLYAFTVVSLAEIKCDEKLAKQFGIDYYIKWISTQVS
jgi:hypothetical protein